MTVVEGVLNQGSLNDRRRGEKSDEFYEFPSPVQPV
ncbi:hypothetical protein HRED_08598 [Candidatus Haloredivivus sp. G17]|nr:hypothetical protein HRED_08598 [Candidatus Haloredivivus sp. G17]